MITRDDPLERPFVLLRLPPHVVRAVERALSADTRRFQIDGGGRVVSERSTVRLAERPEPGLLRVPTGLLDRALRIARAHGVAGEGARLETTRDDAGWEATPAAPWLATAGRLRRAQLVHHDAADRDAAVATLVRAAGRAAAPGERRTLLLAATEDQVRQAAWRLSAALREPAAALPPERVVAPGIRIACATYGGAARVHDEEWGLVVALDAIAASRPQQVNPFRHVRATRVFGFVRPDRALDELERLRVAAFFGETRVRIDGGPVGPKIVLIVGPPVHAGDATGRERRSALWSDARRNRLVRDIAAAAASGDGRRLQADGIDAEWVAGLGGGRVAVVAEHPVHARCLTRELDWPSWPTGGRVVPSLRGFVATGSRIAQFDEPIDAVVQASAASRIRLPPGFAARAPAGLIVDVLDPGDEPFREASHERLREYRRLGWIGDDDFERVERALHDAR